ASPPTGKPPQDENFPVGSWLLPAATRPVVAAFYRVARAADDIADDPKLASGAKLALLDDVDAALLGNPVEGPHVPLAKTLRKHLLAEERSLEQPRRLLEAFRRDARNEPARDWADLMDYCQMSAAPVGRFLLELHDQSHDSYSASDALCAALQILNHIQDCGDDYHAMNRVYVPADWLAAVGLDAQCLGKGKASPGLMRVLSQMLDGVDNLLVAARTLPGEITARGLRMETAVIVSLAERLAAKLRRRDPLAQAIGLGWTDWMVRPVIGLMRGATTR
ncbi:MAG: squalene/phytoene synthase family protein, partial [Alphaproteobacteria bacterium]|nr:squalene/phytoene synthase family protein [Alphaproteobacteria bacterium]